MGKPKLGDLLLEANLIDEVQMKIALEEQRRRGTKFGSTLLALHFVDENVLTAFLSKQLDMPCVSLNNIEISPRVRGRISREVAVKYQAIPVRQQGDTLYVAMVDPLDMEVMEHLEKETGLVISPMVAPQTSISEAIERLYPDPAGKGPAGETAPEGAFADLAREVEALDEFGHHFMSVNGRLDRMATALDAINERLDRLERALSGRAPGTPRD